MIATFGQSIFKCILLYYTRNAKFVAMLKRAGEMEPVNIRIPKTKIQKLDEIAIKNGITRSEVIRHALTIYFQLLENIGGFINLRSLKISPNEISISKCGDLVIMKLKNGQALADCFGCQPECGILLHGVTNIPGNKGGSA